MRINRALTEAGQKHRGSVPDCGNPLPLWTRSVGTLTLKSIKD